MPDLPSALPSDLPAGKTRTARATRPGRALLVGAAVALALVAVACAGSDGSNGGGATATTIAAPRSVTVEIVDGQFDPRRIEVAVGGSVTWVNDDQTEHMIAFTAPNVIGSPLIGKAGSYTRSFDAPGQYRYYCTIHNEMKGEVVVR
jgi:plastocyanin